ncbi:putative uncharacterized protein [Lachnospira eligens CAG:72]|uniref:histidine kinase n=1 Tax=Lachnospira eligens CAG:72 TaxID=1263077 RepID=R5ZUT2_9FIRM|nr:putative uncharacterized protein [[Eubacterium] eligens CAG:72]
MSDTVLIEEEKDIEHIATRKVAVIRKKMMAAFCVMAGIAILIVAVTTGFYELKFRALAAGLYNIDEKSGEYLIDMMFYNRYSLSDVSKYKNVVKECGYTENGASYMYYRSGQWIIAVAGIIIIIVVYSLSDVSKYKSVVMQCGYTENGSSYMYFRSGQWIIAVTGIIIIAVVMTACIRMIVKIGHNDIYSYVINLDTENQQLKKKQKADERFLVERNEKLQNFTENIAHQIKTPLTALSLALDRLEESGENRELLERCFEQIERIRSFISKLMTISRMEAGKIIMTEQDINVNSMLCDVVNQLPKNDCNITVECDDKDYCINADEEWIREAFINIIQNSSELCDKVEVKAACRDDKCIVNIKDNGSGFEEDRIPYVFDRFETTGSAAAGHAGIGLNLSRLIIEAHHGTVDVRNNEDGKGAVIRVQIPRYVLKRKAEL